MALFRHLQQEYDLLTEKLHRLKMALIIETDTAEQFKLEKQIEDAEAECRQIEHQLEGVEKLTLTCPYRGLFAFREQDERFFFGRDTYIENLCEAVQRNPFVAVIGASGSGKSSVVYAGLFPRLRRQGQASSEGSQAWVIAAFRPGDRPFRALSAALIPFLEPTLSEIDRMVEVKKMTENLRAGHLAFTDVLETIAAKHPDSAILLFADQFEELYTLCREEDLRCQFIDLLLGASGCKFLLTMRADFLGRALSHRPLADALQHADLKLGPMNRAELRETIETPAKLLGVELESGLTDRILNAVTEKSGSLPLLEFALTELWKKQIPTDAPVANGSSGGMLTHAAYDAIGGVEQALTRHADHVYETLPPEEQELTRRIFTQLVRPGSGTEDTRRIATREDVGDEKWGLVAKLADARLVVTGGTEGTGEEVEVVHEVMIRGWQRLRDWMEADREFRMWQERLRAALRQWETSEQDEGALLRGAPLAEAEVWLTARAGDLSHAEQQFIQSGLTLREREMAEKEKQRQRELETAQKLAKAEEQARREAEHRAEEQTRSARRLQRLVAGLIVVFLMAVGAALLARHQQQVAKDALEEARQAKLIADQNRDNAQKAEETALRQAALAKEQEAEARRQSRKARVMLSTKLGVQAETEMETSPQQGLLLAVEALKVTLQADEPGVPVVEHAVRTALTKIGGLSLGEHTFPPNPYSPDGHWLITVDGARQTAFLWDLTASDPTTAMLVLFNNKERIQRGDFSPDSHWLITLGSNENVIRLWDLTRANPAGTPHILRHTADINTSVFSPDSRWLATASKDRTIRLWNLSIADPAADSAMLSQLEQDSRILQFSPNSHWLLQVSFKPNTAQLWDMTTSVLLTSPILLNGGEDAITRAEFSPDGRWLVTAGARAESLRLWDLKAASPAESSVLLEGHVWEIHRAVFAPDSRWLATVGKDENTIRLWNLTTDTPPADPLVLFAHEQAIWNIAISPRAVQFSIIPL